MSYFQMEFNASTSNPTDMAGEVMMMVVMHVCVHNRITNLGGVLFYASKKINPGSVSSGGGHSKKFLSDGKSQHIASCHSGLRTVFDQDKNFFILSWVHFNGSLFDLIQIGRQVIQGRGEEGKGSPF